MSDIVHNPAIQRAELLVPKPFAARIYVWPFGIVYPLFLQVYLNHYDKYIGGSEWTFVYLMAICSVNLLFWLMPHWNIDIDAKFNYSRVGSIAQASHVKITPAPNSGIGEICPIVREQFADGEKQVSFLYQKRRHLFHTEQGKFSPPEFKVDELPPLEVFQSATGLQGDLEKLTRNYGSNRFDIPIPTFMELFKEHAVAPFFVFQIFCVALWCMDEQWYYSLFSLFMLVSFEMTTVFQRRTTMGEFQSMGIKPYDVYVYRDKKWVQLQTDQLLPGDVISVTRTNEESALPCDLLLLDGTAIVNEAMLSGESTPLLKESIRLRPGNEFLQPEGLDKNSLLHGGTMALQVTPPENPQIPLAPDHGALAYVCKTGFETSQGSLVRMMIFSSERVSVGNKEAFFFILFLLVFAIAASWYVWVEGTRMGRIQSKLILDCIIVITSVVPPELPMELTMAVNASLSALQKYYIYCTEPFRIPLAGRIDVCCFDKTGTLTAEDLNFEGLAGFKDDDLHHLFSCEEAPETTSWVLGSAHALVKLDDGKVVGDPMEQATLKAAHWDVGTKDTVERKKEKNKSESVKILRRFQFSSALKRSSAITSINTLKGKHFVAVKGAPETLRSMLVDAPAHYEECYKSFTRAGSRVLALGYKYLNTEVRVTQVKREEIESELHFAGFIVFHCPLKDDAIETIEMLNESSHRCVMITGDNPLTACHVAKEVKIVDKEVLILDAPEEHHEIQNDENLVWRNVDESTVIPFKSTDSIDFELFKKYDICITGHALSHLSEHVQILDLLKRTWVYARVSPSQKEFLLTSLKEAGYNTLMCGDGTNDVGALKQAHIGVALLNGTEEGMKKIAENRKIQISQTVYEKQARLLANWDRPPPPVPELIAHLYPPGKYNPHYLTSLEKRGVEITPEIRQSVEIANKNDVLPIVFEKDEKGKVSTSKIADSLLNSVSDAGDEDDVPTLKLGDASVAAPFTSKLANVSSVTNIIRQGRCALVSTIQMYKILALNCLISAYSLSVLYLAGIKFGDGQSTISGILLSVCFLSISRGKPLQKLSKERPQDGIFNTYIMGSILGQFAIHIVTLIYITREIYILEPREAQVDLEKKFEPSLLNTGMFLLQLAQQVSTFAVNYIGLPFKEGIRDNKGMYYGLFGVAGLAIMGSTEFMPEVNQAMQFVPMDIIFKCKLTGCIVLDLVGTWAVEVFFKYFFMNSAAADIAIRD
ncbi:putative manganese-transporting ATPase [Clavispora lusitaniae]|uniref:Manganese-transporting ATPase n=1 Tax=Clavispora lusitaniae TaxID=36911 RepID=A0ACD0WIN8_CLALS|nr:putative manganese-transporting ATPase [Clavispora lusitaniae]QFZ32600.1 putative manganese-transporting ATPase [Clavispora lusitaniae]QFZ38269.1 putative manganese-transporting ATPase [Clavispora lusitaniae]QFZ43952.1 putative manganese-transporting ATPase [Clavispora lusitaniae]QFZ49629.1 putative manganese-transporting ATPase [Clavispora lusitaniae]